MSEFLSMGGYAQYVWPSYAVAVLALVWNIWSSRRELRAAREEARRRVATSADPA